MFRSILAGAQKRAVGVLLLGFAVSAGAESLTTVKTGTLPTLNDAGPLIGLAAIDARPLALAGQGVFVLDAERKA